MPLSPTVPCSTCRSPIYWGTTDNLKRIPIDPAPAKGGNIYVVPGESVVVLKKGDAERVEAERGVILHKSHFATCPQAKQHRKPRRAA